MIFPAWSSFHSQSCPPFAPLFNTCQILKYITSATFCTKNEIHNYVRSTYISIPNMTSKCSKIDDFVTLSDPIFCMILLFSCKNPSFRFQSVLFSDVMVVRTWFLIQEKSEVKYFSKNYIWKKGVQRGGKYPYFNWRNDYVKNYRFGLRNNHQSSVSWYMWSEPAFRNLATPFASPFHASPFAPLSYSGL